MCKEIAGGNHDSKMMFVTSAVLVTPGYPKRALLLWSRIQGDDRRGLCRQACTGQQPAGAVHGEAVAAGEELREGAALAQVRDRVPPLLLGRAYELAHRLHVGDQGRGDIYIII